MRVLMRRQRMCWAQALALRVENAQLREEAAQRAVELEQVKVALGCCSGWCSAGPRSGHGRRLRDN